MTITTFGSYSTVCLFRDEYFCKTNAFYEVRITVIYQKNESGTEYYDIGYTYKFNQEELTEPDDILFYRKIIHPFHNYEDKESKRGEIVRKNKMTTTMIEFLLMTDKDLASEIGQTTTQRYRQDIMLSLSRFWD